MTTPSFNLRAGDALGDYVLAEALGRGGMGIVHRATHRQSQRVVALKTVRVPLGLHLTSIRREIHALSQLHHPGVIRIVDHGVTDGLPWYAMELLRGNTLLDLLASESKKVVDESTLNRAPKLPTSEDSPTQTSSGAQMQVFPVPPAEEGPERVDLRRLLTIVKRVCLALSYVHGNGFVHRDVKPSNIFVGPHDQPVLVDFGIVTQFPGALKKERLEHSSNLSGSARYMSPEQARGESVDARSDLYSLGCVLYEAVTGRPPFLGRSASELSVQHQSAEPRPPSAFVQDLPAGLETVILRLLKKRPQDRIGYADIIASQLEQIVPDATGRPSLPPAAPAYLYKPDFVVRQELDALFEEMMNGVGAGRTGLLVLSGESGVGKTRSVLHLTECAEHRNLVIGAGECPPPGEPGRDHALAPFRTTLHAIADACREGGPEEVRAVIGHRATLLAAVEPAFAGLDGRSTEASASAPVETQQKRFVEALRDTILAFARRHPLLVIVDDAQWADEVSFDLLSQLIAPNVEPAPLLIVTTHRVEETSPRLAELTASPLARTYRLRRFEREQVATMVAGMLALDSAPEALLDYVHERAEGNPLFVSEYLMSDIEGGLVNRNALGEWMIDLSHLERRRAVAWHLPQRIADLFMHRFRKLTPLAQHVVSLAAVIGRESDPDWLRAASQSIEDEFIGALEALKRRNLLGDSENGGLRFVHDQARRLVYESIPSERRESLHARAAEVLEAASDESRTGIHSPALAYHWSRARRPELAYHHFWKAGDELRKRWAHADAITLYSSALAELDLGVCSGRLAGPETLADRRHILEAKGDCEALAARLDDAASSHQSALALSASAGLVLQARLHRKLAKVLTTRKDHGAARREFGISAETLEAISKSERDLEWWNEWIELRVELAWAHYWNAELEPLRALIAAATKPLERWGSLGQRGRFLVCVLTANMRAESYRLSARTIAIGQEARDIAVHSGNPTVRCEAIFLFGFALLFHGDFDRAAVELEEAARDAERFGDAPVRIRAMTYLSVVERFRRNHAACTDWARKVVEPASAARMTDYYGVAQANLAWAAWHEQRPSDARSLAKLALEAWSIPPALYPFQELGRWVLAAVAERDHDLELAVRHLAPLLRPGNRGLKNSLRQELEAFLTPEDGENSAHGAGRERLRSLLALATAENLL